MYSREIIVRGCEIPRESYTRTLNRVAKILLFAVFTGIGAQLAIRLPFTPVPVTMQTLFVVCAGITLGPRDGFYAMISYLAMGAMGAPVFAGFHFGPAVLFGPTGGYLIAFPAAALLSGVLSERLSKRRLAVLTSSLCGSTLILISGTCYFRLLSNIPFHQTIQLAATPFIAGEVIKAFIAVAIVGKR